MDIEYLCDHLHLAPELAALHVKEWAGPGDSVEARTERLLTCCHKHQVPSVMIALQGDRLAGSAMLVANDLAPRAHLTPWLAGVCVQPEFRGQGIASALVVRAVEEAARLGIPRLYLYTDAAESLYTRLGWVLVERMQHKDMDITVMSYEISPPV